MTLCYLAVGSNLHCPLRQLKKAVALIKKMPRCYLVKQSRIYLSLPWGGIAQPKFCNMVLALYTSLPPQTLLKKCQAIEMKLKRIRKKHWGARTMDIDLLLYGQIRLQTLKLKIPHPFLSQRDFVFVPLQELSLPLPFEMPVKSWHQTCKERTLIKTISR